MELVKTKDGSHSLYLPHLDEHYHSHHGAVQEANHVFIQAGLKFLNKKEYNVLEVGFGTGLNALLSSIYAKENNVKINYHGLETFPVSNQITSQLNYLEVIGKDELIDMFNFIHDSDWEDQIAITKGFDLTKMNKKVQEVELIDAHYDIVFYDAFGPRAQNEMWEKAIFEKLFSSIKPEGILVTYCAMGQLKRDLRDVGFEVQSIPGPPGKREMTRALK